MEDFSKYKMKSYRCWSIFIHPNQGYLGRCVIWCDREDALDFADATDEEAKELTGILRDLREAVSNSFQSDWFNYALLGNETRHLHCHFIPRYSSERTFAGITFRDKLSGHNYRTDRSFVTPQKVLEKIKAKIEKALETSSTS